MPRRLKRENVHTTIIGKARLVSLFTERLQPNFPVLFHAIERLMCSQLTESICVMLALLLLQVCIFLA